MILTDIYTYVMREKEILHTVDNPFLCEEDRNLII